VFDVITCYTHYIVIISAKIHNISLLLAAEVSQLKTYCSGNIRRTLPVSLTVLIDTYSVNIACTLHIKISCHYFRQEGCVFVLICLSVSEQNYWENWGQIFLKFFGG